MAKSQLIISDFSGGLNTKVASHLIADNQCVDMSNVTTETGILEAVKGNTSQGAVGSAYFALVSGFNLFGSPTLANLSDPFTFAPTISQLFTIETSRRPVGGQVKVWWEDSGIQSTTALTTVPPDPIGTPSIDAFPGLNPDTRYIYYAVTAYDSKRGSESAPVYKEVLVPVNTAPYEITLPCVLPVGNTADKFKVYRIGRVSTADVDLTEYRYVGEANTNGTTVVNVKDRTWSENAGEILGTENLDGTFNTSANYRCVEHHKGRLFVSHYAEHKLYFSAGGSPTAFEINSYLELPGSVTAMASTVSGLYIFTSDGALSFLTGDGPSNFVLTKLGYATDAIHPSLIARGKGYIMWISKHGIMYASGYSVQNMTSNTFIDIAEVGNTSADWDYHSCALINDSFYFMLGANTLYKYDITQKALSKMAMSGLTQVYSWENKLYGNISNTYYELLNVTPTESWFWLSKEYPGQSYDSEIEWETVKISYIGTPTIVVYVDGGEELNITLPNKTSRGIDKIDLPADGNKGMTIQFKISGDASTKVYSLRSVYSYTNLEN